jgi:hypothetical protein
VFKAQTLEGVTGGLSVIEEEVQKGLDVSGAADLAARLFGFDFHMSNLGALPIETTFGDLKLQSIWGPAVLLGFEGEQMVGVSTLNGSLCLLHTTHAPLPSLLDLMEEVLISACGSEGQCQFSSVCNGTQNYPQIADVEVV